MRTYIKSPKMAIPTKFDMQNTKNNYKIYFSKNVLTEYMNWKTKFMQKYLQQVNYAKRLLHKKYTYVNNLRLNQCIHEYNSAKLLADCLDIIDYPEESIPNTLIINVEYYSDIINEFMFSFCQKNNIRITKTGYILFKDIFETCFYRTFCNTNNGGKYIKSVDKNKQVCDTYDILYENAEYYIVIKQDIIMM